MIDKILQLLIAECILNFSTQIGKVMNDGLAINCVLVIHTKYIKITKTQEIGHPCTELNFKVRLWSKLRGHIKI